MDLTIWSAFSFFPKGHDTQVAVQLVQQLRKHMLFLNPVRY